MDAGHQSNYNAPSVARNRSCSGKGQGQLTNKMVKGRMGILLGGGKQCEFFALLHFIPYISTQSLLTYLIPVP